MRKLKLGAQLNVSFAFALSVPMIIATVFSIVYYSKKIEDEAINKIGSDMKTAGVIYRNSLMEMKNLAFAYAQKDTVRTLISLGLNLGERLGLKLGETFRDDNLDMITIVAPDHKVLVRAHAPAETDDYLSGEKAGIVDLALEGRSFSGAEIIDEENFSGISLTGLAPIYHREKKEITGVVVVRRILDEQSEIVTKISKNLDVNAALFKDTALIAKSTGRKSGEFVPPPEKILKTVTERNAAIHKADISKGGSISKYMPVEDLQGRTVGTLMVQTGVETYISTRNTAIVWLLVIFITGFILAFGIATLIGRRILTPVYRLREAAERIGKGEYNQTLQVTSGDEIGELTEAFNKMTFDLNEYDRQLKDYNLQLEERVKERTAELQIANDQLTDANNVLEETLEILNPGVSRLIGNNQQQLGLVYATELVADICNYTKLNMILGETMMGEFMKKFFRESHKLLAQYRGMFDKTVGDQIVAIFGTPKDDAEASPIHPFDAVTCAMKLVLAAERINDLMRAAIQDNYPAIAARHKSLSAEDRKSVRIEDLKFQCRVGINTSNPSSQREIDRMRMVMMGAETCVDYTAQGGAIIYAFRLESNGTPGEIHIGENTKMLVEHVYLLEELEPIMLKGLGVQSGYSVVGRETVFENIYPKTEFFKKYSLKIPEKLIDLLRTVKTGKIQLVEVRKINEYLEIDIPYLEHLAGFYHLSLARALFSHAVAQSLGLETDKIDAIMFAALWFNSVGLRKSTPGKAVFYNIREQCPDETNADFAEKILNDLTETNPKMIESKIISMCNRFDQMVFDRTYLRNRSQEIISPKEAISLMKIEGKFDTALIQTLRDLMIAPEEKKASPENSGETVTLPKNPKQIATFLQGSLTQIQKEELISTLRQVD